MRIKGKKYSKLLLCSLAMMVCCTVMFYTTNAANALTAEEIAANKQACRDRIAAGIYDCTPNQSDNLSDYVLDRVLTIPIWVHVIRTVEGWGAVSDAQVQSQIDVLNEDFRAMGGRSGGIDTKIQFRLAGITQHLNNFAFYNQDYNEVSSYTPNAWRYINLFSTYEGPDINPARLNQIGWGDSGGDWVGVDYRHFGRNAPAGPPNDLGRVATHYMGRTLGLLTLWEDYWTNAWEWIGGTALTGSSNETPQCLFENDLICDTWAVTDNPPAFSCPDDDYGSWAFPDILHNYMNFTNGYCKNQFTEQQAQRMRCYLLTYRPLWGGIPVYRFWSEAFRTHLYTTDENEANHIIANYSDDIYKYEGVAFYVYPEKPASDVYGGNAESELMPVHRYYCASLKHHFYTMDKSEIQNMGGTWTYEGIAWYADSTQYVDTMPVYRFYSPVMRSFHYTTDEVERDWIIQTFSANTWQAQGIAFYVNKY